MLQEEVHMNIREFCNGIHLQEEAAELVHAYSADPNTYKEVKDCFYNDYEAFTRMIAGQKDAAAWFLYYFVHFSCEAHEEYVKRGLSDQLYWDTFSDLTIWCENCRRDYGVTGLSLNCITRLMGSRFLEFQLLRGRCF